MDFTQDQLDEGLNGVSALTGNDMSGMSGLSTGAKSSLIATKLKSLRGQDLETSARPEGGMDNFDARAKAASPRKLAGQRISESLRGGTSLSAAQLESIGMAHLVMQGQSADIDFLKLDGEISAQEATYLQGVADHYMTNDPASLTNAFRDASTNYKAEQTRAAELAAEAQMREADVMAVKAGLQELGYLSRDAALDGRETPELRQAMNDYVYDTHMGMQTQGRGAEFAKANYGTGEIGTQWRALYDKGNPALKDPALAREMVATGLEGRAIDFNAMLSGNNFMDIKRAEALVHALDPQAGGTIDGTLDEKSIAAATELTAKTVEVPATLDNGRDQINPAAVQAMAKAGGLQMVADEHLTAEQREIMTAFGGPQTTEGQQYLSDLIIENGKDWYAGGLSKLERAPVAAVALKVEPEMMRISADESDPVVLQTVDLYKSLPDQVVDGMPEDVANLVLAKQELLRAQEAYGDPSMGIIRAGIQPDGTIIDPGVNRKNLETAENTFANSAATISADPARLEAVENYLRQSGHAVPKNEEEAPVATPGSEPLISLEDANKELGNIFSQFTGRNQPAQVAAADDAADLPARRIAQNVQSLGLN